MAASQKGLLEAGNIDLASRPTVPNSDGTVSTVRSISIGDGRQQVLIPTVVNGHVVSNHAAIEQYRKTGQHLGKFDTSDNATAFARSLHDREASRVMADQLLSADPKAGQLLSAEATAGQVAPRTGLGGWFDAHPKTTQVVRGAVDTLPAVGGMVGGILSTPETMGAGTVLGGAVGAGVGRGARDLVAEWLQLDPTSSPASKAARIALDTGTAAATAGILPPVLEAVKTPTQTVGEMLKRGLHPANTMDEVATALIKHGKGPAITPIVSEDWGAGKTILRETTSGRFAKAATAKPGTVADMLSENVDSRISGYAPPASVRTPGAKAAAWADQNQAALLQRMGGRGAPPTSAELELASKLGQPGDAEMAMARNARNATGKWAPTPPSSSVRVPVTLNDAMAAAVRAKGKR